MLLATHATQTCCWCLFASACPRLSPFSPPYSSARFSGGRSDLVHSQVAMCPVSQLQIIREFLVSHICLSPFCCDFFAVCLHRSSQLQRQPRGGISAGNPREVAGRLPCGEAPLPVARGTHTLSLSSPRTLKGPEPSPPPLLDHHTLSPSLPLPYPPYPAWRVSGAAVWPPEGFETSNRRQPSSSAPEIIRP